MVDEKHPLAFICYRRRDSAGAALWLNTAIQRTFGANHVFVDSQAIRIAANWREQIASALSTSTLLIVVIGPHWLSLTDEYNRRRIDKDDDWVRTEIRYALQNNIPMIPLLVNASLPNPAALPDDIRGLLSFQSSDLSEARWESDLENLLTGLERLGFNRIVPPPITYPTPHVSVAELSSAEIDNAMMSLPGWMLVTSQVEGKESLSKTELHKRFEFDSFEQAIEFMTIVAAEVTLTQHHPRWENTWRTVAIWLSTWDIGHKPSELDIRLAKFIENLYQHHQPRG